MLSRVSVLGLYGDDGKENGNYRDYMWFYRSYIGVIGVKGLHGDDGQQNGN